MNVPVLVASESAGSRHQLSTTTPAPTWRLSITASPMSKVGPWRFQSLVQPPPSHRMFAEPEPFPSTPHWRTGVSCACVGMLKARSMTAEATSERAEDMIPPWLYKVVFDAGPGQGEVDASPLASSSCGLTDRA